jgi:GH24 family phage-related lysozyme (muramidase)
LENNLNNLIIFVKQFLYPSLIPYKNSNGELAIGYGQTLGVNLATSWTVEQAEKDLAVQLHQIQGVVLRKIQGANALNANQLNALVSLVFDVGYILVINSDLVVHLAERNYRAVSSSFAQFNKTNRVVSARKVARRNAEQYLFNKKVK